MSLDDVKKLRELTGAGMMDCSQCLEEAANDMDKAIEILRKKGLEKAGKKSERVTNEGLVAMAQDGKKIAVASLLCETDFVARNEIFVAAVDEFADKLLTTPEEEFKTWAQDKITDELIVKIGENLQLGDFGVIEGEVIGKYLHADKKQAAVVVLDGGAEELANDVAMQVVAMSPDYLVPEEVPADILEKEKDVYREQMKNEGKPEEVIEKIILGKLNKFYSEVCLVKQPFIKDDKQTIEQILGEAKAVKFARYRI